MSDAEKEEWLEQDALFPPSQRDLPWQQEWEDNSDTKEVKQFY